MQQMVNSDSRYGGRPHGDTLRPRVPSGMVPQGQLTPVNQSQLGTQLGVSGNNGNSGAHGSPSPPESKSATPSPSSSVHEDDADEALKVEITYTYKTHINTHTHPTHTQVLKVFLIKNIFIYYFVLFRVERRREQLQMWPKNPKLPRRRRRKTRTSLRNPSQRMLCSSETHRPPSRARTPMPPSEKCPRSWPPCGMGWGRSRNRFSNHHPLSFIIHSTTS